VSQLLSTATGRLRVVSAVEGLSYALLMFVAMPVKYVLGHPELVRAVGMAHGVLFIAFTAALVLAWRDRAWDTAKPASLMAWSLVPLGAIQIERVLRQPADA